MVRSYTQRTAYILFYIFWVNAFACGLEGGETETNVIVPVSGMFALDTAKVPCLKHAALNSWDTAEICFSNYLKEHPSDAPSLVYLAQVQKALGRIQAAEEHLRVASSSDNCSTVVKLLYGDYLFTQGKYMDSLWQYNDVWCELGSSEEVLQRMFNVHRHLPFAVARDKVSKDLKQIGSVGGKYHISLPFQWIPELTPWAITRRHQELTNEHNKEQVDFDMPMIFSDKFTISNITFLEEDHLKELETLVHGVRRDIDALRLEQAERKLEEVQEDKQILISRIWLMWQSAEISFRRERFQLALMKWMAILPLVNLTEHSFEADIQSWDLPALPRTLTRNTTLPALKLEALFLNIGACYQNMHNSSHAIRWYESALRISPTSSNAVNNVVLLYSGLDQREAARSVILSALKSDNTSIDFMRLLGELLSGDYTDDSVRDSKAFLLYVSRKTKTSVSAVKAAFSIPAIPKNESSILLHRLETEHILGNLISSRRTESSFMDVSEFTLPFYLPYHGMNDRHICEMIAELLEPNELYVGDHIIDLHSGQYNSELKEGNKKVRIGFYTKYFTVNHPHGQLLEGIVKKLNRKYFHVSVLFRKSSGYFLNNDILHFADSSIDIGSNVTVMKDIIANQKLDILIYADQYSETSAYQLATTRLAQVQAVFWGNPITSGHQHTIDYFISADNMESEDGVMHYSEQLFRMLGQGIYYSRTPSPPKEMMLSKESWGLSSKDVLYGCLQSTFKFHPTFDYIIRDILLSSERFFLLVVEGRERMWTMAIKERWNSRIPEVVDRIIWAKRRPNSDKFMGMLASVDIVLHPFPFDGSKTAADAISLNIPFVTMPTEFLRGRMGYSLLHSMSLTNLVAANPVEYVQKARALGFNADLRTKLQSMLLDRQKLIWQREEVVHRWELWAMTAVAYNLEARQEIKSKISRLELEEDEILEALNNANERLEEIGLTSGKGYQFSHLMTSNTSFPSFADNIDSDDYAATLLLRYQSNANGSEVRRGKELLDGKMMNSVDCSPLSDLSTAVDNFVLELRKVESVSRRFLYRFSQVPFEYRNSLVQAVANFSVLQGCRDVPSKLPILNTRQDVKDFGSSNLTKLVTAHAFAILQKPNHDASIMSTLKRLAPSHLLLKYKTIGGQFESRDIFPISSPEQKIISQGGDPSLEPWYGDDVDDILTGFSAYDRYSVMDELFSRDQQHTTMDYNRFLDALNVNIPDDRIAKTVLCLASTSVNSFKYDVTLLQQEVFGELLAVSLTPRNEWVAFENLFAKEHSSLKKALSELVNFFRENFTTSIRMQLDSFPVASKEECISQLRNVIRLHEVAVSCSRVHRYALYHGLPSTFQKIIHSVKNAIEYIILSVKNTLGAFIGRLLTPLLSLQHSIMGSGLEKEANKVHLLAVVPTSFSEEKLLSWLDHWRSRFDISSIGLIYPSEIFAELHQPILARVFDPPASSQIVNLFQSSHVTGKRAAEEYEIHQTNPVHDSNTCNTSTIIAEQAIIQLHRKHLDIVSRILSEKSSRLLRDNRIQWYYSSGKFELGHAMQFSVRRFDQADSIIFIQSGMYHAVNSMKTKKLLPSSLPADGVFALPVASSEADLLSSLNPYQHRGWIFHPPINMVQRQTTSNQPALAGFECFHDLLRARRRANFANSPINCTAPRISQWEELLLAGFKPYNMGLQIHLCGNRSYSVSQNYLTASFAVTV